MTDPELYCTIAEWMGWEWVDGYRMDKLKDEPLTDDPAWDEIRRLERTPLVATP